MMHLSFYIFEIIYASEIIMTKNMYVLNYSMIVCDRN